MFVVAVVVVVAFMAAASVVVVSHGRRWSGRRDMEFEDEIACTYKQ